MGPSRSSPLNVLHTSLAARPLSCPCRFAHASAAQRLPLHRRCPRLLPAAGKLLAIPVVAFGPGLGVPAAVLLFGVRTRDSIATARTLRRWSAWVSELGPACVGSRWLGCMRSCKGMR